ncbi:hypothetical protein HDU91_001086 [Kappamyces sp. JEL0680]|nr:hypothetical protein HDU91_001086 [Kappamyces sp. JEL0680]
MSVAVDGYESSAVFTQIHNGLSTSASNKETAMKKVKSVFQFDVKNKDGKVSSWTLDLKTKGTVTVGPASPKADIIIAVSDADFVNLAAGKLNGQKAFMTGKIKIKGNMMLGKWQPAAHRSNETGRRSQGLGAKVKALGWRQTGNFAGSGETINLGLVFLFSEMKNLLLKALRSFHTFQGKPSLHAPPAPVVLDDGSTLSFLKASSQPAKPDDLPPRVRQFPPRSILSKEQIEEMKTLRQQDPDANTVLQLARRFNTFPGFVLKHTTCPLDRKARLAKDAAIQFDSLPISKKKRSLDRMRRKALW